MKAPLQVLHLEDNPADAELIREVLETEGIAFQIKRVETQADFSTSLEQGRFDLVFADYSLPSFDGLSALKIALEKCPDVPFIFVSGALGEEVAIEALKVGATDYVLKERLSRLVPSAQRALREAEERTQRKRAEQEARAAKARFEGIVEIAEDAIISLDSHQRIILFNQGAEKVFRYTRAEVIDRSLDLLLPRRFVDIHRKHLEDFARSPDVARKMGQRREVSGRRKDGSEFSAEASISKLDLGGEPVFTVILRDITERKRAEEALHKTQAELAHVTRVMTLGEMTASIAHEISQPLAAIVTNGSACVRWLAGDDPKLNEARGAAQRVIRDGNRASQVITRIRALVRKAAFEKAPLDVNQVIQEVINLTQHEAVQKKVKLRTELAGDLPLVLGDRVQLQQVVLNLIMNGIEAMSSMADRPRELLVYSRQHGSDQVLISVRDSGVGIDRENLKKIFDPFYTTKPQGLGMGLAISRSIVENHGGRLWAVPNEGSGATFQFTLLGMGAA